MSISVLFVYCLLVDSWVADEHFGFVCMLFVCRTLSGWMSLSVLFVCSLFVCR